MEGECTRISWPGNSLLLLLPAAWLPTYRRDVLLCYVVLHSMRFSISYSTAYSLSCLIAFSKRGSLSDDSDIWCCHPEVGWFVGWLLTHRQCGCVKLVGVDNGGDNFMIINGKNYLRLHTLLTRSVHTDKHTKWKSKRHYNFSNWWQKWRQQRQWYSAWKASCNYVP